MRRLPRQSLQLLQRHLGSRSGLRIKSRVLGQTSRGFEIGILCERSVRIGLTERCLSTISPFDIFLGDLGPAASAYWQYFLFVADVKLDARVVALAVPRVLTGFSQCLLHLEPSRCASSLFKEFDMTTYYFVGRDICESEAVEPVRARQCQICLAGSRVHGGTCQKG